ncbi:MAG: HAMP domain-containing protein [Deltaproteobacteria bacterium]|nr:HAMP domain-containing protein [Deltaproteobacteria bacterium]
MRLYQKLVLFMLAATIGPLAVVGFALLAGAERELRSRIGAQQAAAAVAAADLAARDVDEAVESLTRTATPIRWGELSVEERHGALRLLLGQSRHFVAALLVDSEGRELAPALQASAQELAPLQAALPVAELKGASAGTVAMSGVWTRPLSCAAALGMAVPGADGGSAIVAVELAFRAIQERAALSSRSGVGELWLYDAAGLAVAAPTPEKLGSQAPAEVVAAAASLQGGARSWRFILGQESVLASVARVPGQLGWLALVVVPERTALASVARMRATVLGSIGVALALLLSLGFAFTRALSRSIEDLAHGARAFAKGDLKARIPAGGRDEMGDLARTFNSLGAELESARARLETWNEDLQRKVEERTAELKQAQAQLLEANKLAAIGQLGAGVAHEINNPLAGILGNAQLLLLDRPAADRDVAILKKIEAQAKRAKEITANLLRFSQQRPQADFKPVELNRLVRETLSLVETQICTEGIELALCLAEGLPPIQGDAGHLAQVLLNLVSNARAAMLKSATKRLTIGTGAELGRVLLEVSDSGKGIAEKDLARIFEPFFTTKDVWSNVGLGLSVSFRIIEEHGGRIEVTTEVGKGSAFKVTLPVAHPTA